MYHSSVNGFVANKTPSGVKKASKESTKPESRLYRFSSFFFRWAGFLNPQ